MPFDIGDTVDLTWNPRDAAGNLVDVGAAVLTLTMPDGSTLTPAVTHGGVGIYAPTSPVITAQPGRHVVRWVATGANAQAYDDTFDVFDTDPGLIISLAEAKKALRTLPGFAAADEEDLRSLIASATGPMEDICGPILKRNCDEWHDGGGRTVRLLHAPVISITSVLEAYGAGYTRSLTLQNLDNGSFDAFGYTVDLDDAILTRRVSGVAGSFVGGRRNVHVVYVAGRAKIPPNLIRATRRLVRWLWQTEMQGIARPASGQSTEATVTTPSGYRVPPAVIELCGAEVQIPGIA